MDSQFDIDFQKIHKQVLKTETRTEVGRLRVRRYKDSTWMVRKRKRSSTIAIGKVHLIYSSGIFLHVPACPLDQNMKHYKQSINTWILAESAKETLQFLTGQMNSLVAGSRLIVVVRDTSKLTLTVFCVHIRL